MAESPALFYDPFTIAHKRLFELAMAPEQPPVLYGLIKSGNVIDTTSPNVPDRDEVGANDLPELAIIQGSGSLPVQGLVNTPIKFSHSYIVGLTGLDLDPTVLNKLRFGILLAFSAGGARLGLDFVNGWSVQWADSINDPEKNRGEDRFSIAMNVTVEMQVDRVARNALKLNYTP